MKALVRAARGLDEWTRTVCIVLDEATDGGRREIGPAEVEKLRRRGGLYANMDDIAWFVAGSDIFATKADALRFLADNESFRNRELAKYMREFLPVVERAESERTFGQYGRLSS
jgi:hypothetical protein